MPTSKLSYYETLVVDKAGPTQGDDVYERWQTLPDITRLRRRLSTLEAAHRASVYRGPWLGSNPDLDQPVLSKRKARLRWKRGSIWRAEVAAFLVASSLCSSGDGFAVIEEALPFLALSFGCNAADMRDWINRNHPTYARQLNPARLVELCRALATAKTRPRYNADRFGRTIGLTAEQRRLGITMIGAANEPKRKRTKRRAAEKAAYKKQRRAEKAAAEGRAYTPREKSLTRTKPWEAEGISRTTWFERRRLAVRGATSDPFVRTISDPSVRTISDPACVYHTISNRNGQTDHPGGKANQSESSSLGGDLFEGTGRDRLDPVEDKPAVEETPQGIVARIMARFPDAPHPN